MIELIALDGEEQDLINLFRQLKKANRKDLDRVRRELQELIENAEQ